MKTLFCLLLPLIVFAQNQGHQEMQMWGGNQNIMQEEVKESNNQQSSNQKEPRWSFGVLYIPYYSGKIIKYMRDPYSTNGIFFYTYYENITLMEGQFTFLLHSRLRLTFDVGYTTDYSRDKREEHIRYDDPNYNAYDSGTIETSDYKIFNFSIGLKYFLTKLSSQKVTPYVSAGVGRQLAFVTEDHEILFLQDPPTVTHEDNKKKFLEDLNSPFQANLGFGAEYSFNKSFSIFSNIRFYYSKSNAFYDYREISEFQTTTGSREYKISETVTRIGLGVNFYF